jgi:hypothetical protein
MCRVGGAEQRNTKEAKNYLPHGFQIPFFLSYFSNEANAVMAGHW